MAQNWNAWGTSWGLSWDGYWGTLDVLPEDTPDYGHATNPNLKLRRIVDVKVRGTGGQLVISGGYGAIKVGQERTATVIQFGIGAVIQLRTNGGTAKAAVHQYAKVSGEGATLYYLPSGGRCCTGFGTSGSGSLIQIKGYGGRAATGVRLGGYGNKLSILPGELDDVFAVRNPTDAELAVIAYQLYKLVA